MVNIRHVPSGRPARKTTQENLKKSFYVPSVVTNYTLWDILKGKQYGWAFGQSGTIVKIDGDDFSIHSDSGLVADTLSGSDRIPTTKDMVVCGLNGTILRGQYKGEGEYGFTEDPQSGSATVNDLNETIWLYSKGIGYSANRAVLCGDNGTILTRDAADWETSANWQKQSFPLDLEIHGISWAYTFPIVATTTNGGIVKSPIGTDQGKKWEVVASPGDVTDATLAGVWVINTQNWVLVGEDGTIIHYQDGELSIEETPTNQTLHNVWFLGSSQGYAVGNNGVILYYDGETWSELVSPTVNALTDIGGITVNNLSICGAGGVIANYFGEIVPTQTIDRSGTARGPKEATRKAFSPEKLDKSTSNIVAGGSYDTGWVSVEKFSRIRASIYADQSLDYHVEFSHDGSNIYAESSGGSTSASVGEGADWANYGYYAKLVVENNSGADTTVCRVAFYGVN